MFVRSHTRRVSLIRSPVASATGTGSTNDAINKNAEIIVHINEALDSNVRNNLTSAILKEQGVFSAEFCPLRSHLLPVRYNWIKPKSRNVFTKVIAQRCSARIIGPI
jgi:hypothetical protein